MKKGKLLLVICLLILLLGMSARAMTEGNGWTCEICGRVSSGKFCPYCGTAEPTLACSQCGEVFSARELSLFCPQCGTALLKAGDSVSYGHYEQDGNKENGKEPVEWMVLDVKNGRALMISRYALDTIPYFTRMNQENPSEKTWSSSALRAWLNEKFINDAFQVREQTALSRTVLDDSGESASAGDRIFVLSKSEVESYFSGDMKIPCTATEYALGKRGFQDEKNGFTRWWARSDVNDSRKSDIITQYGTCIREDTFHFMITVRPAVWIDLTSSAFKASQGYAPETVSESEDKYQEACALADAGLYYSAAQAFGESGFGDWDQKAEECVQHPSSREVWEASWQSDDSVYLNVRVNQSEDALTQLNFYSRGEWVAALLLKGSGEYRLSPQAGECTILAATGKTWYGFREGFGRDGSYQTLTFEDGGETTDLYYWTEYSLSLHVSASDEGDPVGGKKSSWENFVN